ncbi:MAG: NAD-dependent epimerase/dehydratase family protein [Magnetococcales bacterium]|nr:NAD-dependent epimerase/dehydratase family protein [Magnetococcales bacterium]
MRRALLIGGSGFIGHHLCKALLRGGVEPIVLDRKPANIPGVRSICEEWSGEISQELLEEVEVIYYLAWSTTPKNADENPVLDLNSNLNPGLRLLENLVKLKSPPRFVFLSSGGAVYGAATKFPIKENHPKKPIGAYGISKLTFEKYLHFFHHNHALDYLTFRPGNPYGEGQNPKGVQGAVGVFLGKMAQGEPIEIWGDGEVVRDYFYIEDLAELLVASLDYHPVENTPRIFNAGMGQGLSLKQLIEYLEQGSGCKADTVFRQGRRVDVEKIVLDSTLANLHIGWSPKIGIKEGISRTWRWIQKVEKDR